MNSLVHDIKLSKTTIQYGIILVIYLEKGFVVSQYVMMNTLIIIHKYFYKNTNIQ